MEALVWPALALLLYATFTQVPLALLPAAIVIVLQSLVELPGVLVLLWLVPRMLPVRAGEAWPS